MKGAVLVIGSLLWEDENNSLNKFQGKLRSDWRKSLDIKNKIQLRVPIRYGRKSSSKRCTYTMIFSNSQVKLGTAFLIPFHKVSLDFVDIKKQALELSIAEGISIRKYPNRLIASWGAVGIALNNNSENDLGVIRKCWEKEFESFKNGGYQIGEEIPSIKENGELNFEFKIPEGIDYVFATPVKPNISEYPSADKVVEAILESSPRYDTYVKENYHNGIRTEGDIEIVECL